MNTDDHPYINYYIEKLLPRAPKQLYAPVRYILSQNGKKIRFNLTLKACELFSGNSVAAQESALAIEVFHNFTLIHDDIMDAAETRRNKPSVHSKWNTNTGILSGDVMMILAYDLILKCPNSVQNQVLPIFTQAAIEVCEGQQMDMDFESLPIVQMEKYLEMITKKTAILLAASLSIGAYCGGASRHDAELLFEYGKNLGIAFQIRDDLLDCYGEVQKVGKIKAGDIIQGKKTILYIRTWFSLPTEEQEAFTSIYQGTTKDKVDRILEYFDHAEAKEYALRKEQEYFKKAQSAFNEIEFPMDRKKILSNYAMKILSREK